MRIRPVSLLRALLFLSLVYYLASTSSSAQRTVASGLPESTSVSGKVSGFSETHLTLSVGREHTLNTLSFALDSKTKIDGALVVGAQATVEYRIEGDHFIATHIVATPASGMRPR